MASPLRIVSIENQPYRVDSIAYVVDDTTVRRVHFFAGNVETSASLASLQTLIPELIALTTANGDTIYVNAIGLKRIERTLTDDTLLTFNTTYSLYVTEDVDTVKSLINAAVASGTFGTMALQDADNVNITGGVAALDSLQFKGGSASAGTMSWNTDDETVDLVLDAAVTLQIGQEQLVHVKAAENINNGEIVYASSAVGASGKIEVTKFIADYSIDELYVLGVATEDLAIGQIGFITTFGVVRGINLSDGGNIYGETGYDSGTILYASPTTAGYLTKTAPTSPDLRIPTAIVLKANANGSMFVRPNAGYHIGELHDVNISGVSDKDVLQYNSAQSRWENKTLSAAGIQPAGAYLLNVVEDTTPQLGGSLDTQGNSITGNYATDGRRALLIEAGSTRTLAESDAGDFIVTTSTAATTVTIPESATAAFPIGTEIDFIQKGSGALTISASGASVELNGSAGGSVVVTAQWGGVSIKKIDANEWIAVGKI